MRNKIRMYRLNLDITLNVTSKSKSDLQNHADLQHHHHKNLKITFNITLNVTAVCLSTRLNVKIKSQPELASSLQVRITDEQIFYFIICLIILHTSNVFLCEQTKWYTEVHGLTLRVVSAKRTIIWNTLQLARQDRYLCWQSPIYLLLHAKML